MTDGDDFARGFPVVDYTAVTGNTGQRLAGLLFSELGWGVVPNTDEDRGNGIDLFLFARETYESGPRPSYLELGHLTAQVKAGPSAFDEPADGGWWFRADASLRDRWLNLPVPHLVVLSDTESRRAWWAEVTPDAAIVTGVQFKLLIPNTHEVSAQSLTDLLAVIDRAHVRQRGHVGSAWIAPGTVATGDTADDRRNALLVPRLVAPHPNAVHSAPVTPRQALALVASGRTLDLERNTEAYSDTLPDATEWHSHSDWEWHLVAALAAIDDDPSIAETALSQAVDASEAVAAAVVAACALARQGRVDEALGTISSVLTSAIGFDRAWLKAHLGRFLIERGDVDAADEELAEAIRGLALDSRPAAAAVVAGVFTTRLGLPSALHQVGEQLPTLVSRTDTHSDWWAAQSRSEVLQRLADEAFHEWSDDQSIRFVAEDVVAERLGATSLLADLAANHGGWVANTRISARIGATRAASHRELARTLERARRSGDREAVSAIARRLRNAGGLLELLQYTSRSPYREGWWTRTSAPANWRLLEGVAPLEDMAGADMLIGFALAVLRQSSDADAVLRLPEVGHDRMDEAVRLIRSAAHLAGADAIEDAQTWVTSALETPLANTRSHDLARALGSLPVEAFTSRADDWTARLSNLPDDVKETVLAKLVEGGVEPAIADLQDRASRGEARAADTLSRAGQVLEVPSPVIEQWLTDVEHRAVSGVRPGQGWLLAVCVGAAVDRGCAADIWPVVVGTLASPHLGGDDKVDALLAILSRRSELSAEAQASLTARQSEILSFQEVDLPEPGIKPVSLASLRLLLELIADPGQLRVTDLVAASTSIYALDRVVAAIGARTMDATEVTAGFIAPLLHDSDSDASRHAARTLAHLASRSEGAAEVLSRLLPSMSPLQCAHVAAVLTSHPEAPAWCASTFELLAAHTDPRVRRAISRGFV